MQLKTIGESLNVVKTIESTLKATSGLTNVCGGCAVQAQKLAFALKGYSTEAVKMAISESTLNKEQIKAILYQKGLKGEILETTTAELAQVTSTNALSASQTTATATTTGLSAAFKGLWVTMKPILLNPITWIVAAFAAITAGYDAIISRKEKLARTKIEDLDEEISKYGEEIQSLEELQTKLESAKDNKQELAKIQNELNDAIGETTGLLNGEGKAYEIANAKLKANIELKKQQKAEANREKIEQSKDLYENNSLDMSLLGIGFLAKDLSVDDMRNYAKQYQKEIDYFNSLADDSKAKKKFKSAQEYAFTVMGRTDSTFKISSSEWNTYWEEQVEIAYDAFDNVIENYNGIGGKDFIKNIIDTLVRSGSDFSEISTVIGELINNDKLQESINSYWESLVNPDIDSEEALENVKKIIDNIIKEYPQLQIFFTDFYEGIISGGNKVKKEIEDIPPSIADSRTSMISAINDLSEGFEELDKIYSSIKDDNPFDFKLLDDKNFKEAFSGLDTYADFIETITSNSDDIDACREAFNNLLTEWITSKGILNNVTEENANLTAAMLKQMGVANAEEVVYNALARAKTKVAAESEFLTFAKENETIASKNLTEATYEEINALLNEGTVSESTRQYLSLLALSKLDVQNIKLDSKSDIDNIIALAEAAGTGTEYVTALQTALNSLQSASRSKNANTSKDYLSTDTQFNAKVNNKAWSEQLMAAQEQENRVKQAEQDLKDVLSSIQNVALNPSDFYAKADYTGGSKSNSTSSSSKDTAESFNWIERAVKKVQRTISSLSKTVSETWRSWTTRNNALSQQLSSITEEISLQQQAYEKYMAQANSVGLSSYYKNLVQNGAIQIDTISDDNLKDKIKEFQDFYDKAIDAQDAIQDLNNELMELKKTKFDNVSKEYEDRISLIEKESSLLQGVNDLMEVQGYIESAKIYDALIENETKKLGELKSQYVSLNSQLSGIEQGTEMWVEMNVQVLSLKEEIQDSKKALIEYNNAIRDIQWTVFDKLQDRISSITDESEFLIDLISNEKLFDEGKITNLGQATLGLHAVNYNTYLEQAKEYGKELLQIESEIANDPNNQTLLERREKLLEAQRDMIKSSIQEKQTIKDLMNDAYQSLLDTMSKLVDKQKEFLNTQKDVYDYQKNIAEQTKEISKLEKILNAYQGDNSEEAQSSIQQYKVQLEEARQNLQETEYEKYLSDQEKLLDSIIDETENWVNSRLDNLDGLIEDVIQSTNDSASTIKDTLESEANKVGITLTDEMESIWSPNGTFTSIVTTYTNGLSDKLTTVNGTLINIKDIVNSMVKDSDVKANEQQSQSSSPVTTLPPATNTGSSSSTGNSSSGSSSASSDWGSWFISKRDSYPKNKLQVNSSIIDRLKSADIDSSFNARAKYYAAMGGSGTYVGSASQNNWMISEMKKHGYKVGSRNIPYDQNNWIHDREVLFRKSDGAMLMPLGQGDKVFTDDMVNRLWEMSKDYPHQYKLDMPKQDFSVLKNKGVMSVNVGDVEYNIELPNVHNAQEFAEQFKQVFDKDVGNVRKMIDTSVNGKYGSMDYRKYL